jgi:siroheme decarboxylase
LFENAPPVCKNRRVLTELDRALQAIPYDFPVSARPYDDIAAGVGLTGQRLREILADLIKKGVVRRIAAILYHRKAAYTYNAMVVWQVPDSEVERVGQIMASFPEISHCYEREKGMYWDYNVFTMIHGRSLEDCHHVIDQIVRKTGVKMFEMFLSKREFKKTSLMVTNE